jgi:hypothetical protein
MTAWHQPPNQQLYFAPQTRLHDHNYDTACLTTAHTSDPSCQSNNVVSWSNLSPCKGANAPQPRSYHPCDLPANKLSPCDLTRMEWSSTHLCCPRCQFSPAHAATHFSLAVSHRYLTRMEWSSTHLCLTRCWFRPARAVTHCGLAVSHTDLTRMEWSSTHFCCTWCWFGPTHAVIHFCCVTHRPHSSLLCHTQTSHKWSGPQNNTQLLHKVLVQSHTLQHTSVVLVTHTQDNTCINTGRSAPPAAHAKRAEY